MAHLACKQLASTFHAAPSTARHLMAPIAWAAALALQPALAQVAPTPSTEAAATNTPTQLAPVTVVGRSISTISVGGWGDVPLARLPLQANNFSTEQIRDAGATRLSDLVAFDPALSDAYNTAGYWDYLTVRGFVLDNRFNFRRDGLPISAETAIALDNKASVEVLKGASGMQAGTSAPGGLVNYVVKRPLDTALSSATLSWKESGTFGAAVDLSRRMGADQAFGVRVNAAAEKLDPRVNDASGSRHLLAVAGDWRLSRDTLVEAEVELGRQSQPSVPGFSLLGNQVPEPVDPRINLNNQPWTLPVVLEGQTASLRVQHRLNADWRLSAHLATQQLKSDDRIAFPFGCFSPDPAPDGTYYADRYCPDGTFDLYDFRSENERRRTDALDLSAQGKLRTGSVSHELTTGLLSSRVKNRFQRQAFNYAGTGNVQGTAVTPAAPDLTDENTNRDERSNELYVRDAVSLSPALTAWLGLRHTRLERQSVRTDGSRATDYTQSFTTPWLAVSYSFAPEQMVYASWGQGIESEVAPGRSRYTNAGQALPALKSRQFEAGVKGQTERLEWNLAAFDIQRPQFADIGACDVDASCTRQLDGNARHRGVESSAALRQGPWLLRGGLQWLHARRDGSVDAAVNGKEPTNVPATTLKLQADYRVNELPGLTVQGKLSHEGRRMVLPDNSLSIPGTTRVDLSAKYLVATTGGNFTWRAGVDNLFDTRAWREAPYQFGHAYLFPMTPRTWRLSLQVDL